MRPRGAAQVLLAGLLTGGLIASGPTSDGARPHDGVSRIAVRLAAPFVKIGEPADLVAQLKRPAAGVSLTVQRQDGDVWTPVGSAVTGSTGRAVAALDTTLGGSQVLRVVGAGTSAPVTLTVSNGVSCTPHPALVDPLANAAARCLAERLDRWRSAGLMGVGQQLNVSNDQYLAPLDALHGRRVSVVGFDLEELAKSAGFEYPFDSRVVDDLIRLAGQGVVLNASWHANNPHQGGDYKERSWHDLGGLLDRTTPEAQRFWADFDTKLALLQRFQDAGVAVVFRPLHEANGGWFWWGHPQAATYKALWRAMQQRAATYGDQGGLHNIVWGYSFNAVTDKGIVNPVRLLPTKVDLAGLDSYDLETGAHSKDAFSTAGYAAVAAEVRRMAITEAGPMTSKNGRWDPAIISRAARALGSKPAWAMLWYDDGDGKKQLSSLTGGSAWLGSCVNAFCSLR